MRHRTRGVKSKSWDAPDIGVCQWRMKGFADVWMSWLDEMGFLLDGLGRYGRFETKVADDICLCQIIAKSNLDLGKDVCLV